MYYINVRIAFNFESLSVFKDMVLVKVGMENTILR